MALLQSKEEILEAINADIVSNGNKAITGDILNLIFNSIVELMGTGSGGGGGASAEQIYTDFSDGTNLTPEQKAINAQTYAKAKSAFENGSPLPLITVDVSSMFAEGLGSGKAELLASLTAFFDPNDAANIAANSVGLNVSLYMGGMNLTLVVGEDGSCITEIG